MRNLHIAFLFSLGLHAACLGSPLSFFKSSFSPSNFEIKDFHLPVSVELAASPEPDSQTSGVYPISKPQTQKEVVTVRPHIGSSKTQSPSISKKNDSRKNAPTPSKLAGQSASLVHAATISSEIWNQPPVYPEISRRLRQEGRVIIDTVLSDSGDVLSAKIAHTSGFKELDQAALSAVRQWKLDLPPNGNHRLLVPISFKLNSDVKGEKNA